MIFFLFLLQAFAGDPNDHNIHASQPYDAKTAHKNALPLAPIDSNNLNTASVYNQAENLVGNSALLADINQNTDRLGIDEEWLRSASDAELKKALTNGTDEPEVGLKPRNENR